MILEENMLIYYFMPNFIGFHKRYAYSLYIGNDKFACNRYKNEANRRVRVKRDSSYRVRIGLQKDFIPDNLKFIVMRWFCDEGFDSKNSRKILKLTKNEKFLYYEKDYSIFSTYKKHSGSADRKLKIKIGPNMMTERF